MARSDHQKHSECSVTPIVSAMLDRLAEITAGNEQRTADYLTTMAKTTSERQSELKARRQIQGKREARIWATGDDLERLRAKYPGPRGGIDWQAVIRAAIGE